jgi:TRAP transporter 4TM/12TM fusion protein
MMSSQDTAAGAQQEAEKPKIDVDEIVAEADSGSRVVPGKVGFTIAAIAFIWSTFQLYIASPLPFILTELTGVNFTFNNVEARNVHLAFALILVSFAYPLYKGAPKNAVPWYDWLLAAVGAICCLYLIFVKESLVMRAGLPTVADLTVSAVGMTCLAIGVYRALGLPMLVVAGVFLTYTFFGNQPWMPEVIQWRGASFGKAMWHYWMQTEGVFGVALAVSATMIFLFVLFGSLLERAGAGYYFIKLAFALLGHLRGGPAKAAVLASAASGLYSGSSIANVVTTGTFTIPLMKKTGFKPEKAGAVEVASSTNGQLTPPVMGAAAFLIAEFTGISYTDILKHALGAGAHFLYRAHLHRAFGSPQAWAQRHGETNSYRHAGAEADRFPHRVPGARRLGWRGLFRSRLGERSLPQHGPLDRHCVVHCSLFGVAAHCRATP